MSEPPPPDEVSASPPPGQADEGYLAIARIVAAHGLRGEVRCAIVTDFPERFQRTREVYLGQRKRHYVVQRARLAKDAVIVKLESVDSRADAEGLRGLTMFVPERDAVPLEDGLYFWHQVIGLRVVTVEGEPLGSIIDIIETGSNDVYVVRGGDAPGQRGELLIPAIGDVVRAVDIDTGTMTVDLIEGLT